MSPPSVNCGSVERRPARARRVRRARLIQREVRAARWASRAGERAAQAERTSGAPRSFGPSDFTAVAAVMNGALAIELLLSITRLSPAFVTGSVEEGQ